MSSAVLCNEDLKPVVEKLVAEYQTCLSEIDPERILFIRKNGKRRPVGISAVKNPWDLCTSFKFILTIYSNKFDKLDENKQAIAIFDELLRIKDFESGTLNGHSVVGNFETLSKWGLDWLETDPEDLSPIFKK